MGPLLDFAYFIACLVLSPWIVFRLATRLGRRDLSMRFGRGLGAPLKHSIWLHGSSAGEVGLLRPLVALLERDFPGTPLVVSTVTATGLAAARRLYSKHRVIAFPFDFSFIVRRCLTHFEPQLVIIVESEFWPNFIGYTHRRAVPLALVNGKMSAKSCGRYARSWLIPRALKKLDLVAVQSEEHAARFRSLGVEAARLSVTGNMKYDLARAPTGAAGQGLRVSLGYAADDVVVIGGSLHAGEDDALLEAYTGARAANRRVALILVPRYPDEARSMAERVRAAGYRPVRKTAIDSGREPAPGADGVLVVDTVGELGELYGVADVAFVGGSLYFRGANKGGHNLMEPAVLGVPVLFGPYNVSFKDTVDDLLAAGAGRMVHDGAELATAVTELVVDANARREKGVLARRVVVAAQGATDRNYALLVDLIDAQARRLQPQAFDRKMPRTVSGPDSPS